jgi:hypothetical protein
MPDKDYSHRDVTDKLGIQPGQSIRVVGRGDRALLARVRVRTGRRTIAPGALADIVFYWPKTRGEITPTLRELRRAIQPAGGIWVITAKRNCTSASGMAYLSQDALIPFGLDAGLVDNKICSISDNESAMRFVIRRKDRAKQR